jgi:hypothetical protein
MAAHVLASDIPNSIYLLAGIPEDLNRSQSRQRTTAKSPRPAVPAQPVAAYPLEVTEGTVARRGARTRLAQTCHRRALTADHGCVFVCGAEGGYSSVPACYGLNALPDAWK